MAREFYTDIDLLNARRVINIAAPINPNDAARKVDLPVAATEVLAGITEIATQAETDAGIDDARFVTPLKLAMWTGAAGGNLDGGTPTSTPAVMSVDGGVP